jgi:hypothetical protein
MRWPLGTLDSLPLAKTGSLPALPANINDVLARLKQGKIVGRTVVRP